MALNTPADHETGPRIAGHNCWFLVVSCGFLSFPVPVKALPLRVASGQPGPEPEKMQMNNLLSFNGKMIPSPAKQSCRFSMTAGWPEGPFSLEIIFL
jgi:hypothetical protein